MITNFVGFGISSTQNKTQNTTRNWSEAKCLGLENSHGGGTEISWKVKRQGAENFVAPRTLKRKRKKYEPRVSQYLAST